MSLIVTIHVKEGIVMASDSRTTYQTTVETERGLVTHFGVHLTDTTYKTFVTESGIGISTCGDSSIQGLPITGFIETFIRYNKDTPVDEIPKMLLEYFKTLDTSLNTEFQIAGYKDRNGERIQRIYRCFTETQEICQVNTTSQGAVWNGEIDVLSRLINPAASIVDDGEKRTYNPFPSYDILWQYFTLQDAIEFAEYAIRATIDTMKFQSRVKTVGGPIDILVIRPEKTEWIAHKELHT